MKILMLNGSPRPHGNTAAALEEMEKVFAAEGLETELIHVGNRDIRGCIACGRCAEMGRCVFDDIVNELSPKFEACDGLVLTGLPYFYAGATASGRGTVQVSVRQGIDYLSAIAHSLLRQGFKRQVYISFHGPAHMTCSPMVRDFFDETGVPILYIDLSMQMFKSAKDLFKSMDAFHAITVGAYQLLGRLEDVPLTTEYSAPHTQTCAPFNDLFALAYQSGSAGDCFADPMDHHRHSRRGHAQSSGRRRSGADWRDREAHGYAARRRADAGPESIYGPRRGTVPLDAQRIQQRQMTHRSPAP